MSIDLIEALREKIIYLEKMRHHLLYSYNQVSQWWRVDWSFDDWSDEQLESLAAFKARFSEMQDHLASTMKLIATVEQEDTRLFTYVLNYMVQLNILDNMEDWLHIRGLRNAATHDYSASEEAKALHFHQLFQHTDYLIDTMDSLVSFVSSSYTKK